MVEPLDGAWVMAGVHLYVEAPVWEGSETAVLLLTLYVVRRWTMEQVHLYGGAALGVGMRSGADAPIWWSWYGGAGMVELLLSGNVILVCSLWNWTILLYPHRYTLAPAQVLSNRISPKPSSVYSRSGTGAHLRVFTKALFLPMNGLHFAVCATSGLILALLHVFAYFLMPFTLMLTSMLSDGRSVFRFTCSADWRALRPGHTQAASQQKKCFWVEMWVKFEGGVWKSVEWWGVKRMPRYGGKVRWEWIVKQVHLYGGAASVDGRSYTAEVALPVVGGRGVEQVHHMVEPLIGGRGGGVGSLVMGMLTVLLFAFTRAFSFAFSWGLFRSPFLSLFQSLCRNVCLFLAFIRQHRAASLRRFGSEPDSMPRLTTVE